MDRQARHNDAQFKADENRRKEEEMYCYVPHFLEIWPIYIDCVSYTIYNSQIGIQSIDSTKVMLRILFNCTINNNCVTRKSACFNFDN